MLYSNVTLSKKKPNGEIFRFWSRPFFFFFCLSGSRITKKKKEGKIGDYAKSAGVGRLKSNGSRKGFYELRWWRTRKFNLHRLFLLKLFFYFLRNIFFFPSFLSFMWYFSPRFIRHQLVKVTFLLFRLFPFSNRGLIALVIHLLLNSLRLFFLRKIKNFPLFLKKKKDYRFKLFHVFA